MATTLFFDGRTIAKPGAFTRIDASALESRGLSGTGRIAIIGSATSGVPASAITRASDFTIFTRPSQAREELRSGDLREAVPMGFDPSADTQIQSGAQEIVAVRVDPATQSSATFGTTIGDAMDVTSLDYGAYTEQIAIEIGTGTNSGKLVSVEFEGNTEAFDDLGGDTIFSLEYLPPTGDGGWESMAAQVLDSGVRALGGRTDMGLDADVVASITLGNAVRVTATAGDATKIVTIYGLDTSNVPRRENLTLINGSVTGTQTWNAVLGATLNLAAAGTVTIEDTDGGFTDLILITIGETSQGLTRPSAMYVANTYFVMAADNVSTASIIVWGRNAAGTIQGERIVLSNTTHVRSANNWSRIDVIVLGGLAAARTLTTSAVAAETSNNVQDTLQKVADYYNGRSITGPFGFDFTIVTARTTLDPDALDRTAGTGTNVFNVVANFTATLNEIVETLASQSQYVTATVSDFEPQIRTITITAVNGATYTVTVDGTAAAYTADGSATVAEIQAGLTLAIENIPALYAVVEVDDATNAIAVSSLTPTTFTLTVGANLVIANTQEVNGVGSQPDNTTAPVFLAGGVDGTPSFSDWQVALDALKLIRVNTIIPLSGDPAVHAALDSLLAFKAGPLGKSECDGIVGLSALDGSDQPTGALPTQDSIQAQIVDLNSRHIRALGQSVTRFNTAGEREEFAPWFGAVLAAGMQAGTTVGVSLTNKFVDILDVDQNVSWNPVDDAEEMIQSGLLMIEDIDGVGRRWVRNVTTHLTTDNIAFVEGSVNAAVNFAAFEFRNEMERVVGQLGFAGTISAARGGAQNKLDALVRAGVLTFWDSLDFELNSDVLETSVQIAPILPINFVPITMHLVNRAITG